MSETRTVFLTGAASGIGAAIARSLIAEGHFVVVADRQAGPLNDFASELGPKAFPLVLDITDVRATRDVASSIPAAFGSVDTLINNAGSHVGGGTKFAEGSVEDWASIVETNLIGLMRVTHALLPGMIAQNRGHIVNISSINALRIIPTMAPYGASKAGAHMLTDTLRAELADKDIKVTEIHPGLTRTNIQVQRFHSDTPRRRRNISTASAWPWHRKTLRAQ